MADQDQMSQGQGAFMCTPREPPMVLVHKGWLVLAERPVHRSVLIRYRNLRRRLRGRPFWRGLSARWQRL